jgi:hypothetical protein
MRSARDPSSVTPSTFFLLPELLPAGAGTLQRDRHHHNGNFYLLAGGRWVELPIERQVVAVAPGRERGSLPGARKVHQGAPYLPVSLETPPYRFGDVSMAAISATASRDTKSPADPLSLLHRQIASHVSIQSPDGGAMSGQGHVQAFGIGKRGVIPKTAG